MGNILRIWAKMHEILTHYSVNLLFSCEIALYAASGYSTSAVEILTTIHSERPEPITIFRSDF